MKKSYLRAWIDEHYQRLCESEWYDNCFDGESMDDIETDFFIETYLVPLIESNVSWDFGRTIDARALLGVNETTQKEV